MACTRATHVAISADRDCFERGTLNRRPWDDCGIVIGECLNCPEGHRSTIAREMDADELREARERINQRLRLPIGRVAGMEAR